MCDQIRPIYVDVSTHARDAQAKLRCPHRFPDAQTKHKQPDARQCKHKCSAANSKPRALYSMLLATMYNVGSAVCALTMLLLKSILQDP